MSLARAFFVLFVSGLFMSDEIKAQIVSPEVRKDTVIFRLRAPDAERVRVVGIEGQPAAEMDRGDRGIWSVQIGPLAPELYSYAFEIDGTRVTDPSNRNVKKWLSCNSMFEIRGGLLHEQQDVPHGSLTELIYDSTTTGSQRNVLVYLPPGETRARKLPVVYLLHGYGDDHLAWKEVGRAHFILDNLIAEQKIRPCVVVMPYGHPVPIDLRKEFDDYAETNLERMERDLLKDLMPLIEKQFPVSTTPSERAIVGLSMGGGQSLTIGLKNADQFGVVGGFSSASPQGTDQELDERFASLVEHAKRGSHQEPAKLQRIWIACGKEDFLFQRNNRFVDWLKSKSIQHTYHVSEGGHDWMVWRRYLAQFLQLSFPQKQP